MKKQSQIIFVAVLFVLTAALYRIIPGRPFGFEPISAMAIFGGAVVTNKKWAFALPLGAMLFSDALFQALYAYKLSPMPGFYEGQWFNYLLLAGLTFIGIAMKRINVVNVLAASLAAPVIYFLLSNGATWLGHGGYNFPMTGEGLYKTYFVALEFFRNSIYATLIFSGVFFGTWYALKSTSGADSRAIPA